MKPVLDDRGMTALHAAVATESPNVEAVRLLLAKGADPAFANSRGETARDWAAKFQRPEVMKAIGLTVADRSPAADRTGVASLSAKDAFERGMALLEKPPPTSSRRADALRAMRRTSRALPRGLLMRTASRPTRRPLRIA